MDAFGQELLKTLILCLKKLHLDDRVLFDVNACEDCLNHRLGLYLTNYYEKNDITVDLEYNRHLEEGKYYTSSARAIVDIVIHTRNSDASNILAIECKKIRTSKVDIKKIASFLSNKFYYSYGAIIIYGKREIIFHWNEQKKMRSQTITY